MSKVAQQLVDAILAGESPEVLKEIAREAIEKKARKALKRRRSDWMTHDVPASEYTEQAHSDMGLEEFVSNKHPDLDREINDSVEILNERAGGFHYNALPKIHQTLMQYGFKHVQSNNRIHHYHRDETGHHVIASCGGYKLRLSSGKIVTGRHHKHLQQHLIKYSR